MPVRKDTPLETRRLAHQLPPVEKNHALLPHRDTPPLHPPGWWKSGANCLAKILAMSESFLAWAAAISACSAFPRAVAVLDNRDGVLGSMILANRASLLHLANFRHALTKDPTPLPPLSYKHPAPALRDPCSPSPTHREIPMSSFCIAIFAPRWAAATAASILSRNLAERMRNTCFFLLEVMRTLFLYLPSSFEPSCERGKKVIIHNPSIIRVNKRMQRKRHFSTVTQTHNDISIPRETWMHYKNINHTLL